MKTQSNSSEDLGFFYEKFQLLEDRGVFNHAFFMAPTWQNMSIYHSQIWKISNYVNQKI